MKSLIVIALSVVFATPALAAEFYILKDPKTGECNIRESKPAQGPDVILVDGKAYATRDEAQAARKATAECSKEKK